MPPTVTQDLPGTFGKDYSFVRYGGVTYVVYYVDLPNNKRIKMSWKVDKKDYARFGVTEQKIRNITRAQHEALEFFGNAGDIQLTGDEHHPFEQYIREMRKQYGNVSWLHDREFMSVFLMGYAENVSPDVLQNYLRRTKWYQSRTDRQRTWELEIGKADKHAQVQATRSQMTQILSDLYGPDLDLVALGFTDEKLKKMAEKIASGWYGDPSDGLMIWAEQQRAKAADKEGTPAWIEEQQAAEQRRAYMNRPEEIRADLRDQAFSWLGPSGVPDFDTLTKWAKNLASGVASEEDWTNYIQNRAHQLYPWLGPNETWQDAASPYRQIAERLLGQPVDWNNSLLSSLGAKDANGSPTGQAMSFDEYEQYIRSTDAFFHGPVGREEGWNVFATLDNVFNGRTY